MWFPIRSESQIAYMLVEANRRRNVLIKRRNVILDSFRYWFWPWTRELKRIDAELDQIETDVETIMNHIQEIE